MKRKANPIAIMISPPIGQPLPDGWASTAAASAGGTFDRRDWNEVFKAPQWSSKFSANSTGNIIQNARLSK